MDGPGTVDIIVDVNGYFTTPALATRDFFYSPELNLLSETNAAISPATPTPLYEYIWFNGRPVAQENVSDTSALRYTITDHLGTPFLQTNSSGAVTWRAEYEPFGNLYAQRVIGSTDYQPLRFPGQEERSTTFGRSYNVFRWYRPDVGQYTQPDPIGLRGDLNLFRYAFANPLSLIDPTGEITCKRRRYLKGFFGLHLTFIHHTYIRVGPSPRCEDNPSFGFFGEISPIVSIPGTVKRNDQDTSGERCIAVPSEDDIKVLQYVNSFASARPPYVCVTLNCWTFTDAAIAYGKKPDCCAAAPVLAVPPAP